MFHIYGLFVLFSQHSGKIFQQIILNIRKCVQIYQICAAKAPFTGYQAHNTFSTNS